MAFSPDGKWLTYLQAEEGSLTRRLLALSIATGEIKQLAKPPKGVGEETSFSLDEQLRRER